MARDSRLLLIETVIPEGNTPSFAKLLDIHMLVWPGGLERTEEQYRALLESAGLSLQRVISTRAPVSIIEAQPSCAATRFSVASSSGFSRSSTLRVENAPAGMTLQ